MNEAAAQALRQALQGAEAFVFPFPLEALVPLERELTGQSIEVLFDRAARKSPHAPAVVRFPHAASGERDSAAGAKSGGPRAPHIFSLVRRFREERGACEITSLFRSLPPFQDVVHEICLALGTPMETLSPTILLAPAGCEIGGTEIFPCPTPTILIHVAGGACRLTPAAGESFSLEPGTAVLLPRGSRMGFQSPDASAYFVKIALGPRSIADVILSFVNDTLEKHPAAQQPAVGLFAPDPERRGTLQTLQGLATIAVEALTKASPAQLAEAVDPSFQPPPPEETIRRPPGWFPDTPYRDSNWGLQGLRKRADDIFIVTFQRSGTTWTQMILYCLMTDGQLDRINHIYEFAPYVFTEYQIAGESRIERMPSPRVLKSHQPFESIYSSEGKYIYVARDGLDVLVSSFHHQTTVGPGKVPLEVFADRFLSPEAGAWLEHVHAWHANRSKPNILFLTYGQLQHDFEATVKRIAVFIGVSVTAQRLKEIAQQCSFASMKAQEAKFDHNAGVYWLHRQAEKETFLRHGVAGEGAAVLTSQQQAVFRQRLAQRFGGAAPDFASARGV